MPTCLGLWFAQFCNKVSMYLCWPGSLHVDKSGWPLTQDTCLQLASEFKGVSWEGSCVFYLSLLICVLVIEFRPLLTSLSPNPQFLKKIKHFFSQKFSLFFTCLFLMGQWWTPEIQLWLYCFLLSSHLTFFGTRGNIGGVGPPRLALTTC